jgi:hypothetical protein
MTSQQFDVFLSHSSADKPWVIKLKDDLLHYGVSVWLDKDEIRPGDLFGKALEQALDSSQAVALVVSPEAINSGWVEEEYYRALSLAKDKQTPVQIIPVILRDAELPGFLQSRNWVDFRDETTYAESVRKLVWGITGRKPAQVPDPSPIDLPSPLPDEPPKPAQEQAANTTPPSPFPEESRRALKVDANVRVTTPPLPSSIFNEINQHAFFEEGDPCPADGMLIIPVWPDKARLIKVSGATGNERKAYVTVSESGQITVESWNPSATPIETQVSGSLDDWPYDHHNWKFERLDLKQGFQLRDGAVGSFDLTVITAAWRIRHKAKGRRDKKFLVLVGKTRKDRGEPSC